MSPALADGFFTTTAAWEAPGNNQAIKEEEGGLRISRLWFKTDFQHAV